MNRSTNVQIHLIKMSTISEVIKKQQEAAKKAKAKKTKSTKE